MRFVKTITVAALAALAIAAPVENYDTEFVTLKCHFIAFSAKNKTDPVQKPLKGPSTHLPVLDLDSQLERSQLEHSQLERQSEQQLHLLRILPTRATHATHTRLVRPPHTTRLALLPHTTVPVHTRMARPPLIPMPPHAHTIGNRWPLWSTKQVLIPKAMMR